MKNRILKVITWTNVGVFLGSGAYLLDSRYIEVDGDTCKELSGIKRD